jgi:hypothetical protein
MVMGHRDKFATYTPSGASKENKEKREVAWKG